MVSGGELFATGPIGVQEILQQFDHGIVHVDQDRPYTGVRQVIENTETSADEKVFSKTFILPVTYLLRSIM